MERQDFFEHSDHPSAGPLQGLVVVEATTTWSGPMAGCVLGDLGADVIKVELPSGDVTRFAPPLLPDTQLSFAHQTVNRNKRSLALDLRTTDGADIFLKLAARADVVIENFLPGTLDSWGLGFRDIETVRPDCIYLSISGWGQYGELSDRPGYDPATQAVSGWMSLNGEPDGVAVKAPTFLADDLAGLHGAVAVLAALRHREATGEGQHIDVALLDSLLFQSNGFLTLGAMGAPLPRMGSEVPVAAPCNTYRCTNGDVFIALILDSHWTALANLMGRQDLVDDPELSSNKGRVVRRDDINQAVSAWFAEHTVEESVRLAAEYGVAVSPVNTFGDAAQMPHVIEREMLQEIELEDGSVAPIVGPAAKFSRTQTKVRSAAAKLGAHTNEILSELGYSPQEIESFQQQKVI